MNLANIPPRSLGIRLALELAWYLGLGLSAYGGLLAVLGLLDSFSTGWLPPKLKDYAPSISGALSITGTVVATLSIYSPPNPREADAVSKRRTGPLVLVLCGLAVLSWVLSGRPTDDVLNGVAMLGLGVSTLRLMSHRERPF